MPSWVEESEMMKPESEMNAFFNYTFKVLSLTKEMKMLKSGYLIKEMFERFKQKAQHKLQPNRSLWIYSGHDITISHFLNSLNLFDVIFFMAFLNHKLFYGDTNFFWFFL